jgi:hypothetical protein
MSDKLTDTEIEQLKAKKQKIREELYDQVKEEMFEASSALEGITPQEALDDIPVSDLMSLPPEEGIAPDSWVILEVNHEGEQFQKILSGWSGGYLDGDSWRLSSPIKEINIKVNQDYFTVDTDSGSRYTLWKSRQGLRMSNAGIWNELKEKFGDSVEIVEL